MDLNYTLRFYSDWHCGSGLAAGANLDALVIRDADGLPFVPGKTIKGLMREALQNVLWFQANDGNGEKAEISDEMRTSFANLFGNVDEEAYNMHPILNTEKDETFIIKGSVFFSNAELEKNERAKILDEGLTDFFYRSVTSISIKDGIAENGSLRKIETVIPCDLKGYIIGVPDEWKDRFVQALKYIKRLGLNRNRGLGRCDFII